MAMLALSTQNIQLCGTVHDCFLTNHNCPFQFVIHKCIIYIHCDSKNVSHKMLGHFISDDINIKFYAISHRKLYFQSNCCTDVHLLSCWQQVSQQGQLSLSSSLGAITVHSAVAPSGELHSKGRCGVFAGKTV